MNRRLVTGLVIGCVLFSVMPVLATPAEDAAKAFEKGQAELGQGHFDEALQLFQTAAKADSANRQYGQSFSVLRQVIQMRSRIASEQNPDQWMAMARALRTFYRAHKLYAETLPLDRKAHEQGLAADSAEMLAETLVALGENSQVVELLAGLDADKTTARANVLLGLALAKQGKLDEAKALAAKVAAKGDAGQMCSYELARLYALIGETEGMAAALVRTLELTRPSQITDFRAEVRVCPDFAAMASGPAFAKAIQTESKIAESSCSKGSSCGKCPNRSKCGGSKP